MSTCDDDDVGRPTRITRPLTRTHSWVNAVMLPMLLGIAPVSEFWDRSRARTTVHGVTRVTQYKRGTLHSQVIQRLHGPDAAGNGARQRIRVHVPARSRRLNLHGTDRRRC